MQIIYTSKGVLKMLGCALSTEKYGSFILTVHIYKRGERRGPCVER
jgi:hypothetical protein